MAWTLLRSRRPELTFVNGSTIINTAQFFTQIEMIVKRMEREMISPQEAIELLRNELRTQATSNVVDVLMATEPHCINYGGFNLTDEMIDAPRQALQLCNQVSITYEQLRDHLEMSGSSIEGWPDYLKTERGHITKAGWAIIIFSMMNAVSKSLPEL